MLESPPADFRDAAAAVLLPQISLASGGDNCYVSCVECIRNGTGAIHMVNSMKQLLHPRGEVHYIGGTDVLPPPLEPEEEAYVLSQLDTRRSEEARAILMRETCAWSCT